MESEYRKQQAAKQRAARALQQTKKRLGVFPAKPLRGAEPSPLVASAWQRKANPAPTSDKIPGSAPLKDLMHAHKWKRGAGETPATAKEIHRKAMQIAPAYNKGALQYLPAGQGDEWREAARKKGKSG